MNWLAVTSLTSALVAIGALAVTALSFNTTQQGQYTDRYTKAIDELDKVGTEHLQARLGGIYSLERLAHDSARDQSTIIEVLSAFIRTATPTAVDPLDGTPRTCPDRTVAPDVQAALTVLGRRDTTQDNDTRVDLRQTCIRHAELTNAHLSEANLNHADLAGAYLENADLAYANLTFAHFDNASIPHADLTYALLNYAYLTSANLDAAKLTHTNFDSAHLEGTDLRDTDHDGAVVVNATANAETRGKWW
ncbi:pentapeptide repeat-containing protein [Amycolatopsis sp. cmx-4-61]|uniref:pentapeptide repeat-containing protein n=1 Tax=Amycolatopsis sp. cmx-4-61 TaxID=2790937 RepID=UPI0039798409